MEKILRFRIRPSIEILRRFMCTPQGEISQSTNKSTSMAARYRPSELQKFILVWTKKYKSKADIPKEVSLELIERSRSEARIKLSNYLILLTILASLYAVISGKAAAKRGESVQQMNLDWHKQYVDEFNKKEAEKKQ